MKKSKSLLGALLAIAMCLCLIAGATFALFSSESKTNIAVTSGKVDIVATAEIGDAWSTEWDGEASEYVRNNKLDTITNGYKFTNKGTVVLEDGTVTGTNLTPGDGLRLDINVVNRSEIKTKYRIEVKTETDDGLLDGFDVTYEINDDIFEFNGYNPRYTDWMELEKASDTENGDSYMIHAEIELPVTAGNKYQDKTANFVINVLAVQWNGDVKDPDYISSVTASTTIGEYAESTDWTENTQRTKIQLDNVVTLTTTEGDINGTYNSTASSWDLYQEEDATLAISVPVGYDLESFAITYSSGNSGVLQAEEGAATPNIQGLSAAINPSVKAATTARIAVGTAKTLSTMSNVESGISYNVADANKGEIILTVSGNGAGAVSITDIEVVYHAVDVDHCNHNWGEGEVTLPATCSAEGVRTFTCSICRSTQTETIKKIPHNPKELEAESATCDKPGKTAGSVCDDCGETITKQEDIPALGHDWTGVEPTWSFNYENKTATATFTCARPGCEHKETKVDEDLEEVDVTDATCTANKTFYLKASVEFEGKTFEKVGEEQQIAVGTATNHASAERKEQQDADCTNDGLLAYWYCEDCDTHFADNDGERGEKIANFNEWKQTEEPEGGLIKAGAHVNTEGKWVNDGESGHHQVCDVCGEDFNFEDHYYGEDNEKQACVCGDWCYKGTSDSFTIDPKTEANPLPSTGAGTNITNGKDTSADITFNNGKITITFNQGTASTNTRWWNTSGTITLRMYTNSSFTVEVDGVVTKIVFGVSSGLAVVDNYGSLSNGTWTKPDDGESSFVSFNVTANVTFASITITYEAVENHIWQATDNTEVANCAHGNLTEMKCTRCGETYWEDDGAKTDEHIFAPDADTKHDNGAENHSTQCSVCEQYIDHVTKVSKTDDAHNHSLSCDICSWTSSEEHNYEDDTCVACDYVHEDHEYGEDGKCTICNAVDPEYNSGSGEDPVPVSGSFTITRDSFASTASGYALHNWSAEDDNGTISGVAFIYATTKDKMQFNTSQNSYYIASNQETQAPITKVTVTTDGTSAARWILYTSSVPYNTQYGKTTTLDGTSHGQNNSATTVSEWELDGTDTYFALALGGSGVSYITSIVIEYSNGVTSGGTTEPEQHVCENVCQTCDCGGCTSECLDPVCANKCTCETCGETGGDNETVKTYTLTLTAASLGMDSSGYANNNKDHTVEAKAEDGTIKEITIYSYQVYQQSSKTDMQWQNGKGYLQNTTNSSLGNIKSITIEVTSGTFTVYGGTSAGPSTTVSGSNGTYNFAAGNGFFKIAVGSGVGYVSCITIVFEM